MCEHIIRYKVEVKMWMASGILSNLSNLPGPCLPVRDSRPQELLGPWLIKQRSIKYINLLFLPIPQFFLVLRDGQRPRNFWPLPSRFTLISMTVTKTDLMELSCLSPSFFLIPHSYKRKSNETLPTQLLQNGWVLLCCSSDLSKPGSSGLNGSRAAFYNPPVYY